MVGLGDLPGGEFFSHGAGVSADGSVVVGGGTSASGFEAFRWTAQQAWSAWETCPEESSVAGPMPSPRMARS
jgi:uncharacterized membrane protein